MQVEYFIEILMLIAYTNHSPCLQLKNLLEYPALKDRTVEFAREQQQR